MGQPGRPALALRGSSSGTGLAGACAGAPAAILRAPWVSPAPAAGAPWGEGEEGIRTNLLCSASETGAEERPVSHAGSGHGSRGAGRSWRAGAGTGGAPGGGPGHGWLSLGARARARRARARRRTVPAPVPAVTPQCQSFAPIDTATVSFAPVGPTLGSSSSWARTWWR